MQYSTLITHGGMLTAERAKSLWDAGIHQFNISLDYLDERHDNARGIPGLAAKILDTIPRMQRAWGQQHSVQYGDPGLQSRSAHADREAREGAGLRSEFQLVHRFEEWQSRRTHR